MSDKISYTKGTILYRSKRHYDIRPHPEAPLFAKDKNPELVLQQLVDEVVSKNFSTSELMVDMFKQASLVSLYFYLTVIAAYSGPYDQLNDHLHLDMCNFRQSDACMGSGARAGMFLGRSHYKTTVGTHGPEGWEVVRNPDIRIGLYNAVIDKAYQFLGVTMDTFKNNELFKAIFPEFVIPRNQAAFIVPCRTRKFPEPTIKVGGVGGSSAGDHFDLADMDDIVSEQHLNGMREASAEMYKIDNWFSNVKNSILQNQKTSRLLVKGTRYSIDDPYQKHLFDNCKKYIGYLHPDFKTTEFGEYTIYYRRAIENGQVIFPEAFTLKKFEQMQIDDFWQYQTQYMNDPHNTGMSELRKFSTHPCALVWEDNKPYIKQLENKAFNENKIIPLAECDVVMTLDPAATEKGVKANNCRSSLNIWAMDCNEQKYLIWCRCAQVDILQVFDWIFEGHRLFKGYIRVTIFESNAFQRVLKALLRAEELRRGVFINAEGIPGLGDKNARIRSNVGSALMMGQVWLANGEGMAFTEEKNIFPQSENLRDCLDSSEKAFVNLIKPMSDEERYLKDEYEEEEEYERSALTGY